MSLQVHGATVLPLRVCSKLQNVISQLLYKPSLQASPIQSLLVELTLPDIPIFLSTCWPLILSSPGLNQAYHSLPAPGESTTGQRKRPHSLR